MPHRRRNPLTGRWVLVSPHRAQRPWQGQNEAVTVAPVAQHDASCPLCPGNRRSSGEVNPAYDGPYVFTNDHAALTPAPANDVDVDTSGDAHPLFAQQPARGTCRVVCYSPDHGRTLPQMGLAAVGDLVDTWCAQTEELGRQHAWVQVFENKGEAMGCSQPHPHGQIWATGHLPDEAMLEDQHQRRYHAQHGRPLLLDVARREAADGRRLVLETAHWLVVVPFWATWPFETLLMPRGPVQRLPQLGAVQRADLALALKRLTARYDNLFACSFPYSMGWHGAPFDGSDPTPWQLHAHFYPPLLRSASVRKFMVGYEMLAEAQRDITPEQAADLLRRASDVLEPLA